MRKRFNFSVSSSSPAFTIVELLVVIVVIGILAAITLVSYNGITQKAIVTTLQSDLSNASDQLKIYQATYGSYPTTMAGNCPTAPTADNAYCIKASNGNTLTYTSITPTTFHLTDTNTNNTSYSITDSTAPAIATTVTGSAIGSACPTGFIPVPGSGTYGTNDFCVMKYAASHSDATSSAQGTSTVPISAPSIQQWTYVSQTTAIADAPNVAGCTGCHLITEAEWMTIAQNVLSVASNWSGAVVGSGYISSGHNDSAPNNALVADPSDANGNAGETNQTFAQKRTLTLTNGQVIWDLAGNVLEWTAGTIVGNAQPGFSGEVTYAIKQWDNGSLLMNGLPILSQPSSTGIAGITWDSSSGIGQLFSDYGEPTTHAFLRGGYWNVGNSAGVLYLYLSNSAGGTVLGFRVSR